MKTLGERIKQLRTEKELTQEDLAQKLNVSKSSISLYETNTREPSISTLIALTQLFDVSTDYILGISDYRHTRSQDEYIREIVKSAVNEYLNKNPPKIS